MQGELNKNVVRGERERALQTSFFPTQPSSPDVYGLYKLLRARECPPLWSEQQQCRSPDLSLSHSLSLSRSLFLSLSLSWLPHCKSIQTHKQRQQLGNRTIAILQWHSIMTTSDRFHTLLKNSRPPHPLLLFSISHSLSITASLAHTLLPLSSNNYCKIYLTTLCSSNFYYYLSLHLQ